jgi:beta-glucanase (GH16 family)
MRVLAAVSATLAVAVAISVGLIIRESSRESGQTAGAVATAPRITVPAGWTMTLDATFSGTKLNTKLWATCYWWSLNGCTNNPKLEKEWYLPSQVKVSDGALHLVAKQKATYGKNSKGKPETYSCRSGMVTSAPGFNFKYGLVQVVAQIPYGPGLWPALWLAASNHQWPPEIDILEHWNSQPQAKVYVHPVGAHYFGGAVFTPGNLSKGWHTFRLLWNKTSMTWYIDGVKVYSTKSHVPQQAMYFIANLADTTAKAGACTGSMAIKSVKVWTPKQ